MKKCKDCKCRRTSHSQFKDACAWWITGDYADNCYFYTPKLSVKIKAILWGLLALVWPQKAIEELKG